MAAAIVNVTVPELNCVIVVETLFAAVPANKRMPLAAALVKAVLVMVIEFVAPTAVAPVIALDKLAAKEPVWVMLMVAIVTDVPPFANFANEGEALTSMLEGEAVAVVVAVIEFLEVTTACAVVVSKATLLTVISFDKEIDAPAVAKAVALSNATWLITTPVIDT